MSLVRLVGAILFAPLASGYYIYPRFTNASIPAGGPTGGSSGSPIRGPTNGPTAGPVPVPAPRPTRGTIPGNTTTQAPPVVPSPNSPSSTTLIITGSDGNPTPVPVVIPPGLTTSTILTVTGADGVPTPVPFIPPGSGSSPSISTATVTGTDGNPTPVPVTIPPGLSTSTTITITGADGIPTPVPIIPPSSGDTTTDPPAVVPPGAPTQTVTSASTTSTSTIEGVTSNTVITTTGDDGAPTPVPVLSGCSICNGGDIVLGGVPDVPGVYIIPGILVPIVIGSDLLPTLGTAGEDPSNAEPTSCETTVTATNFWVSCDVTDAASSPICTTTSSSETAGCSVTGTASTTTGSSSCPLATLNPDDGEGEDGPPPSADPTTDNPPPQPTTEYPPPQPTTEEPPPQQTTESPPPPPVTCEQVCDCAENVPSHACRCFCYCSDGSRHADVTGKCEDTTRRKREESLALESRKSLDTAVREDPFAKRGFEPHQPLLNDEPNTIQLRAAEDNTTNPIFNHLEPRAPLTFAEWEAAVCKGKGYFENIQSLAVSSATSLNQDVWSIQIEPVSSISGLPSDTTPSDCTSYLTNCKAVPGGSSYKNILCRDGTLVATQNYKRNGCTEAPNWSDVVGAIATEYGYSGINKMWRYMILNGETIKVMDAVFKRAGSSENVAFTFEDNTDQGDWGRALLSTPNGRGTAYLVGQWKSNFGTTLTGGMVTKTDGWYYLRFDSA